MTNCRSCHARIFWARTDRGSRIPVDADPVDNGNLTVDSGDDGFRVHYVDAGVGTHVSHFATCPDAAKHRKRT